MDPLPAFEFEVPEALDWDEAKGEPDDEVPDVLADGPEDETAELVALAAEAEDTLRTDALEAAETDDKDATSAKMLLEYVVAAVFWAMQLSLFPGCIV